MIARRARTTVKHRDPPAARVLRRADAMPTMDVQDLRIFARLARVQSLSAVAAEMELSPGTISKRLQSLEMSLRVRLFDRTTRSIRITQEGEKLLAGIEPVLAALDAAVAEVTAHACEPRGRLRVTAPTSLGRGVIPSAFCAFLRRYPDIELNVHLTDRVVGLTEGGYDLAIRLGELKDSSHIARRLAPDPQVIAASPSYLAKHPAPATPDDLEGHACLVLGDEPAWSFLTKGGIKEVRLKPRLRSDNGELLRHAAVEGLGIVRISRARVADALDDGRLVEVLAGYKPVTESAIYAVYPSSRHLLPKLRALLDFLAEWFKDDRRAERELRETPASRPRRTSAGRRRTRSR